MLVLSRKKGQSIKISDSITVTVLEIRGNVIRLGITAPPAVKVLRSELLPLLLPDASSPSVPSSVVAS